MSHPEEHRLGRLVALLCRPYRDNPADHDLEAISRLAPLATAICLSSLLLTPKLLADDISNAVDAFDRDLGLERMGPDIVNLDQQGVAAESFKTTKNG